jgi:hypothetical protein
MIRLKDQKSNPVVKKENPSQPSYLNVKILFQITIVYKHVCEFQTRNQGI